MRFNKLFLAAAFVQATALSIADAQTPYRVTHATEVYTPITGTSHVPVPHFGMDPWDEGAAEIPLPFAFNWYGQDYTSVWAFTNGFVSFQPPPLGLLRPPTVIPSPANQVHAFVGVLWQDLEGAMGRDILSRVDGVVGSRVVTIELLNFQRFSTPNSSVNFQVRLYEGANSVEVVYGPNFGVIGATAGIENEDGTEGLNLFELSPSCDAACSCQPAGCNSTNMIAGKRVTVELPPEPEILGSIQGPPGAFPGTMFDVLVRVRNVGQTGVGAFSNEIYITPSATTTVGGTLLDTFGSPALGPQTVSTSTRTLLMPPAQPVGVFYLALVVDSNMTIIEVLENNNVSFSGPIATASDLVGTVTVPVETGPGEMFDVSLNIDNNGAPVAVPVTVNFYLSPDQTLDVSDTFVDTRMFTLQDGFSFSGQVTLTTPLVIQPSPPTYYMIAAIDEANTITESDDNNNDAVSMTTVSVNGPEVEAVSISSGPFAFRGMPYLVSTEITNNGGATARDFTVCLVISDNLLISLVSDPIIEITTPFTLAPGESQTLELQPTIPTDTSTGTWYIASVADCGTAVFESNENNNIERRVDPITIRDPAPDFVPVDISTTATAAAGETILVSTRIANLGNAAGSVHVRLVVSPNPGITLDDTTIFETTTPLTLMPPGEDTLSVWAELPGDLDSGGYYIGAIVDPADDVDEVLEDNNSRGAGPILVVGADLAIVTPAPPPAVIGVNYIRRFAAVGGSGDFQWSIAWMNGEPAGLSFDPATAELSGVPAEGATGGYPFTLTVGSGNLQASRTYNLQVSPPTIALVVVSSRLPPSLAREPYSVQLVAAGGMPPYSWRLRDIGVPDGISVSMTGSLGGEPQIVGAYNFEVEVADAGGSLATGILSLDVVDPEASVTITTAIVPNGIVGTEYETAFAAAGGAPPYTWRLEGAVPGVMFDSDGARLTGTPTVAGDYPIIVEVRDDNGLLDRNAYVLDVLEEGALQIVTGQDNETSLPEGTVGEPYLDDDGTEVVLRAVKPGSELMGLRWAILEGSLPPGLLINPDTGLISGTPDTAGVFPFIVQVLDSTNDVSRTALAIIINEQGGGMMPTDGDDGCSCSATEPEEAGPWSALGSIAAVFLLLGLRRRKGLLAFGLASGLALSLLSSQARAQPVPYQVFEETVPFVPLGATATEMMPGLGDGNTLPIQLPFSFHLYDQIFTTIYVNANGLVSVNSIGTGFHFPPSNNPEFFEPNGFVAGLWADWCSSAAGCFGINPGMGVFYEIDPTPGQGKITIEYRRLRHFSDDQMPSDVTFQIILHEGQSSLMELHYGPITAGTDFAMQPTPFDARIGIEDPAGTEGMWLGPCAGVTPCTAAQTELLSNTKITIVADAGEDVTAAGVSLPEVAYPGLPMAVSARVLSRHQNPLGPFHFAAYLIGATDTSTDGAPRVFESGPISLMGFESSLQSFNVEVPNDTQAGQYKIAVVVDSRGELAETSEVNNVAISTQTIRIADRAPDFQVLSVMPSQTMLSPGDTLDIDFSVRNFGNEPGELQARVVLSTNNAITTSDLPFGTDQSFNTEAREVVQGSVSAQIPQGLSTGTYYVGVIVDHDLNVLELDEANNVGVAVDRVIVASNDVQIITENLPVATLGQAFSTTIDAAGGSGDFEFLLIDQTRLPRGMIFDSATAELHGIPLQEGAFALTFEVRSGQSASRKELDLQVVDPSYPLTFASNSLPAGVLGSDYAVQLRAVGGMEPYSWRVISGSLPQGIFLANNGTIFGSPDSTGFASFTVEVRDNTTQTASASLGLEIRSPGNLTITSHELSFAELDEPYSQQLFAAGGVQPLTWRVVTSPPPGLLVTSDGAVTGIPELVGSFSFSVEATDARGNADTNLLLLSVEERGRFSISTEALPLGEPNTDYRAIVKASGGRPPLTWELVRGEGVLPAGFDVRQSEGIAEGETPDDLVISGRLEREGVWAFTVRVSDSKGRITERALAIVSRIPPPMIVEPTPKEGGCSCTATEDRGGASCLALLFFFGFLLRRKRSSLPAAIFFLTISSSAQAQVPYVATQYASPYVPLTLQGGATQINFPFDFDDGEALVAIGFPFDFYGTSYTHLTIGVNGAIVLANPCTTTPQCGVNGFCDPIGVCGYEVPFEADVMPNAGDPNRVIAVFWDDLVGESLGVTSMVSTQLIGTAPNREFVIQWGNIGAFPAFNIGRSTANFQIRLGESGSIRLHYGAFVSGNDDFEWNGVIGIENETGLAAVNPVPCSTAVADCSSVFLASLANQIIEFALPNDAELIGIATSATGGDPGSNFTVDLEARNIGPLPAGAFSAEVYFSTDATIDPMADTLLGTLNFGGVAGNSSAFASLNATVPQVAPGFYTVGTIVDSANTVIEVLENNNISIATNSFLVGADLSITVADLPPTGPLETADLQVSIINNGSPQPAVGVAVYFSEDQMFDQNDRLIATATIAVPAQPLTPLTLTATIPGNLVPGPYWVIARVDPNGTIQEADENNNEALSMMVTQLTGAELSATDAATPDAFAFSGVSFRVSGTISNNGGASARDFYYAFYFSENELISVLSDPLLQEFGPITLLPGEVRRVSHTITIPAQVANGMYFLGLVADSLGGVLEEVETNNISRTQTQIEVRDPAPDLTVTQIQTQPEAAAGESMIIGRTISNVGNASVSGDYAVYLSTDRTIDPTQDILLGPGSVTLDAGEEDVGVDNLRVPASLAAGIYYVGYVIDPAGQVEELFENNNNIGSLDPVSVLAGELTILTRDLPIGTIGVPYEIIFAATGGIGSYTWSVVEPGVLPDGISLSAEGSLSGTPSAEGTFDFGVAVTDGGISVQKGFTMIVSSQTLALEIVTTALLPGFLSRPYEYPLTAFGGIPPYVWTHTGSLPAGLTMDASGVIRGVPTQVAAVTLNFRVEDATGDFSERPIPVRVVSSMDTVRLSSDVLPDGRVGEQYDHMLRVEPSTGASPFNYELFGGELPPGLVLELDKIIGVPTTVGRYSFAIRVRDDRGDFDINRYVVSINELDGVNFVTNALPEGEVGKAYTDAQEMPVSLKAISTESMAALRYSIIFGQLPVGLSLSEEGGITGTPASAGVFTFSALAVDEFNQQSVRAFGIRVVEPEVEPPPLDNDGCGCSQAHRSPGSHRPEGTPLFLFMLFVLVLRKRRAFLPALMLTALTSTANAQVPYFIEALTEPYMERAGGTPIPFPNPDDQQAILPLPFDFNFFENSYTQVTVGTNGYVTFGGDGTSRAIQSFPSGIAPNNLIALFWGDLETFAATTHLEGTAPNRVFIIQYEDASPFFSFGGGSAKFQLFLYEGLAGRFEVRYGGVTNMTAPGDWLSTTGFENGNGTVGFHFLNCLSACNGNNLNTADGMVFRAQQDGGEDVVAGEVLVPPVVYAGVPFDVELNLSSIHQNALGPFVYTLHLLASGETELNNPIFTSGPINLMPYETLTQTVQPAVDIATPLARYRVGLQVDAADAIMEPNETNNISVSVDDFRLAARQADFTILDVVPSETSVMPGSTISVDLRIRNAGNEMGTADYAVVVSRNEVISTDDRVVLSDMVSLELLTTATVSAQVDIPADLVPGDYYIGVFVDPQNQVAEISEVNNAGRSDAQVRIVGGSVSVLSDRLPDAYVGVPYSFFLAAQGGDGNYDWSIISGTLTPGLNLLPSGEIRGTAMEASSERLEFQVESGGQMDTVMLDLEVVEAEIGLTIVTREVLPGVVGASYPPAVAGAPVEMQQHLIAIGGTQPATFILRSVPPPGIELDEDGYLHGVPLQKGIFELDVEASDGTSTATRKILLTVAEPGRLTLVAQILPDGVIGEPYEVQLRTIGQLPTSTVTFTSGGPLPLGLTLTMGGKLVGVPQSAGVSNFAVLVTEGMGPDVPRDTGNFRVQIDQEAGFGVTPSTLPEGIVGEPYDAILKTRQGRGNLVWRVVGAPLPRGLRFEVVEDAGQQALLFRGTPEVAELASFTVLVVDEDGRRSEQPMSILILEPQVEAPVPIPKDGCSCVVGQKREDLGLVGLGLMLGLLIYFRREGRSLGRL